MSGEMVTFNYLLTLAVALFAHSANGGILVNTDELAPLEIEPKSLTMCPNNGTPYKVSMKDMQLKILSRNQLGIAGTLIVQKHNGKALIAKISPLYCDLDGSNCLKQAPIIYSFVCDRLQDKNTLWEPMVKALMAEGFNGKCPGKVGNFAVRDVLVNIASLEKFQLEPGRWLFKIQIYDVEKTELTCFKAEAVVKMKDMM